MHHVLLVPNFRTNILSVHLLKKRSFNVLLNEDNGRIVPILSNGDHSPVSVRVSVEGNVYILRILLRRQQANLAYIALLSMCIVNQLMVRCTHYMAKIIFPYCMVCSGTPNRL